MKKNVLSRVMDSLGSFLGSRYFLIGVIVLFVAQALWVAWSFTYPMVYDEYYHFKIIEIYSQQWSPFILNQPVEYDHLRDLGNETSFLFHYLLSYPLRLAQLITTDQYQLVFFIRSLNIAFAAIGLFGFYKLLRRAGIASRYVNIGLLLFATLPIVPFLAATTNYDNMLFAATPFFLLAAMRVINAKKLDAVQLLTLVGLGLFAGLVKYTALPLVVVIFLFVAVYLIREYKKATLAAIVDSFRVADKKTPIFIGVAMLVVLLAGLFSSIYIKNAIAYGTPSPSCQKTMALERCLSSQIVKRNTDAVATKDERIASRLSDYTIGWFTAMWKGTVTIAHASSNGIDARYSPTIYYSAVFYAILLVLAAVFYGMGAGYFSTRSLFMLMTAIVVIAGAVYIFNANGYYKANIAFANQSRYILSAMPILIVFGVYSFAMILQKVRLLKYLGLGVIAFILVFGGGILTHILMSDPIWYRPSETVHSVNRKLQSAAKVIVIEHIRR